jgi:hypothetical protein
MTPRSRPPPRLRRLPARLPPLCAGGAALARPRRQRVLVAKHARVPRRPRHGGAGLPLATALTGRHAATNGSATDARLGQSPRPFSGQAAVTLAAAGWARSRLGVAHPERSAGLGLDRWKPALLLYCDSAGPGRSPAGSPLGGGWERGRPKGAAEDAEQPQPPNGDGARAGRGPKPKRAPPAASGSRSRLKREAGDLPHAKRFAAEPP